jgi:hypothetical protein
MVELYRSLGFEVYLEPLSTEKEANDDECKECRICFEGQPEGKYMVIYTRQKGNSNIPDQDYCL